MQGLEHLSQKDSILWYGEYFYKNRFREIGGQNKGPCVRFFCEGNDGKEWKWCASFVTEIVQTVGGLIPKTFDCNTIYSYAKKSQLLSTAPIPGYLFLVPRSNGTYSHVGIVREVSPDGKTFRTYEGNSNGEYSPEGREVTSLIRSTAGYTFVKTYA